MLDALIIMKDELIALLQENKFEHLSQREQARLRDYLKQTMDTLQAAAERKSIRRTT